MVETVVETVVETAGKPFLTYFKREPNGFSFFCNHNPGICSKFVQNSNHMNIVDEFNAYRERMNDVILGKGNLVMKRLWNLDTNTYQEGALDVKTKEMLGLVASMVLRCDDCIKYHLGKCHGLGLTTEEVYEIFSVANIVGGTIVVPHTRRGAEYWEALIETAPSADPVAKTSTNN